MNTPTYYMVIPAEVWSREDLKEWEMILYGHISTLTQKDGVCYATNGYFSKIMNRSKETISRAINKMAKLGLFSLEYTYKENSKEIEKRLIRIGRSELPLDETNIPPLSKSSTPPLVEIVKDNTIKSINTTSSNKEKIYKKEKLEFQHLRESILGTLKDKRLLSYRDKVNQTKEAMDNYKELSKFLSDREIVESYVEHIASKRNYAKRLSKFLRLRLDNREEEVLPPKQQKDKSEEINKSSKIDKALKNKKATSNKKDSVSFFSGGDPSEARNQPQHPIEATTIQKIEQGNTNIVLNSKNGNMSNLEGINKGVVILLRRAGYADGKIKEFWDIRETIKEGFKEYLSQDDISFYLKIEDILNKTKRG